MGRFRTSLYPHQHSQCSVVAGILSGISLLMSVSVSFTCHGRQLVDRIAAEVNSSPILYSEVQEKVTKGPQVLVSMYPANPKDPPFAIALQDTINMRLILDHAAQIELEVSDEDIENHLKRIMAEYKLDRNQLKSLVEREGKSFDAYLSDIRKQMLLMRFQGRVIMPQVKLTDKDIEAYYIKKFNTNPDAVLLSLRQIVVTLPPANQSATRQAKRTFAESVWKKLRDGMSFKEAEKLHSEDHSGREDKPAQQFRLNELNKTIRLAVEPLEKNNFSRPVEMGNKIYIFYLEDRRIAAGSDYEEKKAKISFELRQKELASQMQRWLREERQKSKIKLIP